MIQDKIFQYFDGNPDLHVLFIFDQMGMLQAEIAECDWPVGYRVVPFDGQWFTVKYNLTHDWKDDKVVLIFTGTRAPESQDEKMDFPLYGELKANMIYSEEDYLTFMQLRGIPDRFGPYIAAHIGELQLSKYNSILEQYYDSKTFSVDVCNRGLLSGYLNATKLLDWDEIVIRLICWDANPADKDKSASFFRLLRNNRDGMKALENYMMGICNVSYDVMSAQRMRRFAESFKYNSITQNLTAIGADDYKSLKINDSIMLQRLNSFRETAFSHPVLSEQFVKAIDTLAANIHEDKIISWYGDDAEYALVTEALSWPILAGILKDKAISDPVGSNERLRAFSLRLPAESLVQEVIDFLSNSCFLLEKMGALGSFALKSPQDYVTKYITEFYLIDAYYRNCVGEFKEIPASVPVYEALLSFKKSLDEEYSKKVNLFNQEWLRCIKESGTKPAEMPNILHQQEFYEKKLKGLDAKRVVIISDALRYEVAVDILNGLGSSLHEATIEPALAILPTETKYSKLTLLPHSSLRYDNGTLFVDGEILDTMAKRKAQVQKYEPNAVCIDFNEISNMSKNQAREVLKSKLVYIFHDTIDSISHDNPQALATACKTTVTELKKYIHTLHSTLNVTNVFLTSDHGFLFNDLPFEEKDKQKVDDNYEERKTRYYITDDTKDVFGVTKFRMEEASTMENTGKTVAVPNGSTRFNAEGGGYQFAHGGATLQEMLIPVLYSHIRRDEKKPAVGVTLLSTALTMVSSRLKFSLIQSDAVSELFSSRKILCGIYEGGNLISKEKEVSLDSTDVNPQNRFYPIELTLARPASGGILELRIYDSQDKDRLNPLAKAIVTNKTLIDQDF